MFIGLIFYFFNLKSNPKLKIWIPGLFFLFLGFIFTNVEALIFPELFNLFEHISYLFASISMFLGTIYYYKHFRNSKKNNLMFNKKTQNGVLEDNGKY